MAAWTVRRTTPDSVQALASILIRRERGRRLTRLGDRFLSTVSQLLLREDGIVHRIESNGTPRLAVENDLSVDSLLLTVLVERGEVKVDDSELRVGTVLVPVLDPEGEDTSCRVEEEVVRLVPVGSSPAEGYR